MRYRRWGLVPPRNDTRRMRRRQYLATLATTFTVGIAGCNGASGTATPTESTTTTTAEPTTEATTTPTPTPRDLPDIELESFGLDENQTNDVPNRQAEAIVRNLSEQAVVNVQVRARWYNADGHLLGDDFATMPILPAGERWSLWVYPWSVTVSEIKGVELSASVGGLWSGSGESVVIEESTIEEESDGDLDAFRVHGLATNDTGGMASLSVYALLRIDDGTVLYAVSDSQSDVPAGDTWVFDTGWEFVVRSTLVDDYTLFTQGIPSR